MSQPQPSDAITDLSLGVTAPPSSFVGRRWVRSSAIAIGVLVLVAAGVGVGMAAGSNPSTTMRATDATASGGMPGMTPSGSGQHSASAATHKAGGKHAIDPPRQAWAHEYGLDRSTMPNLADVSRASAQERAAATDLLTRTEAATAKYADLSVAKAAGFDLQTSLSRAEKRKPGLIRAIALTDAGAAMSGKRMPMLHVSNQANRVDGKVLDASAPETLMYAYAGQGHWTLIGVMYTANESYPQAPPDPGGPITRWHYHDTSGGQNLMMHIFFVPGNDLAHAYAAEMTS